MKLYNWINKTEIVFVAIVTAILVVVVFFQVINRTIIKASVSWPEEAARYLMVWQVFMASVIAFRRGANCCIDIVVNRFKGKGLIAISCFANLVCLVFAATIIVMAIQVMQTQISFNQTSTALNMNMAFFYAALPVWGVLFVIELGFMTRNIFKQNKEVATS